MKIGKCNSNGDIAVNIPKNIFVFYFLSIIYLSIVPEFDGYLAWYREPANVLEKSRAKLHVRVT